MKFSCEKYELQAAITVASRAAASKSPIPALEGLLLEAGSALRVTGFDLKLGIYTDIPADVAEPGTIVLNAKLLGDMVRSLPDDVVTIAVDDSHMAKITCGKANFDLMGSSAEDFPELPSVDHQNTFTIGQGTLRTMIAQTVFAVSDNESRPVYTGSLFEVEEGKLTLVSVDGYRLALRREEITGGSLNAASFIVPGISLSNLEKICPDSEENVTIALDSKHVSFRFGDTVMVSRRLDGEFMNYKKTVPTAFNVNLTVERTALVRSVERVSLVVDDRSKNPIRCTLGDGVIDINCLTGLGRAQDSCLCEGQGGGMEIGFNNRYLLDALRAAPADKLMLRFNSGSSPCIAQAEDGSDSFLYMVLPVRLRAGE